MSMKTPKTTRPSLPEIPRMKTAKATATRLLRRLIEKPADRHAILTKALEAAYLLGIEQGRTDDDIRRANAYEDGYEQGVEDGMAHGINRQQQRSKRSH